MEDTSCFRAVPSGDVLGGLPLALLGADAWPPGVPVQLHAADANPSLEAEYDASATELLWERALAFCGAVGAQAPAR
jgi:hypothetical protein